MLKYKAIIWDYNGTLLDDLSIGVKSINKMLLKRGLPILSTERYREVFTFPVKKYYENVGFDFKQESWAETAKEFIAHYTSLLAESTIFPEAMNLLSHFSTQGKRQFILSAMEQQMLNQSTEQEKIQTYFDEISGIDNIYASSKIENGKKLLQKFELSPGEVCLLGDTSHDYEVAKELGCKCILVASGHQSFSRLQKTGCPVIIQHLNELIKN